MTASAGLLVEYEVYSYEETYSLLSACWFIEDSTRIRPRRQATSSYYSAARVQRTERKGTS